MKTNEILVVGAAAMLFSMAAADEVRAQSPATPAVIIRETGTISAFNPSSIAIRLEAGDKSARYITSKTTVFMDESGATVPLVMLKMGVPVAVDYVEKGGRLVARKVMVLRSLVAGPAIVEKKTPVMTAAVEGN
jgi:hypothetical protein